MNTKNKRKINKNDLFLQLHQSTKEIMHRYLTMELHQTLVVMSQPLS